jgi:hypothetical protein
MDGMEKGGPRYAAIKGGTAPYQGTAYPDFRKEVLKIIIRGA